MEKTFAGVDPAIRRRVVFDRCLEMFPYRTRRVADRGLTFRYQRISQWLYA